MNKWWVAVECVVRTKIKSTEQLPWEFLMGCTEKLAWGKGENLDWIKQPVPNIVSAQLLVACDFSVSEKSTCLKPFELALCNCFFAWLSFWMFVLDCCVFHWDQWKALKSRCAWNHCKKKCFGSSLKAASTLLETLSLSEKRLTELLHCSFESIAIVKMTTRQCELAKLGMFSAVRLLQKRWRQAEEVWKRRLQPELSLS